jgi:hypothetical protein
MRGLQVSNATFCKDASSCCRKLGFLPSVEITFFAFEMTSPVAANEIGSLRNQLPASGDSVIPCNLQTNNSIVIRSYQSASG